MLKPRNNTKFHDKGSVVNSANYTFTRTSSVVMNQIRDEIVPWLTEWVFLHGWSHCTFCRVPAVISIALQRWWIERVRPTIAELIDTRGYTIQKGNRVSVIFCATCTFMGIERTVKHLHFLPQGYMANWSTVISVYTIAVHTSADESKAGQPAIKCDYWLTHVCN